ncbi:MAG: vitamin K epoxide reductase family protein [Terriglobales bacterium]|jgi:vitamin-K-epoxide reductase (warfarin-sensitive)
MKALTVLIIILALAGVVVSTVVLKEHYSNETSVCDINAKWDCGIVNHTPYSLFRGIPVAMIGIVGYALIGILAGRFPILTALAALGGLGFALRLTYFEWKVIGVWCIYCVSSQVIIACLFLVSVIAAVMSRRSRRRVIA